METKFLPRYDIAGLIGIGLIGTVTFIKKNGDVRVLTGRMGVSKHTVGGERTADPNQYLIVWEIGNKEGAKGRQAYRNVNILTIQSLVLGGIKYIPSDLEANELPTSAVA